MKVAGNEMPHPFEIFHSLENGGYCIFVPKGCLLVDGKIATNASVENENLALPFGDSPPPKVYCHLHETEDGEWEFFIDGNETLEGARYNFLIATFGARENDGGSYDVVCSAMSFGGGTANADEISIESSYIKGEGEEAEIVDELAIQGWHNDDPMFGSGSVAASMGLPVDTETESSSLGEDALLRVGGAGGFTRYRDIGVIDKSKLLSEIAISGTDTGSSVTITRLDGTTETFDITDVADFSTDAPGVETLEAGSPATADVTLTDGVFHFDFGIPRGADGVDGEQGPQGPQGEQGPQGPQGEQGPQGPQGEQGPQGQNGADGADGKDGDDGVSVTEVEATPGASTETDGYTVTPITFTFVFSDGTAKTATANVKAKNGSAASGNVSFVEDVSYDKADPGSGIKKKVSTLNLATGAVTHGDLETFAETSPHSEEHSGGEA